MKLISLIAIALMLVGCSVRQSGPTYSHKDVVSEPLTAVPGYETYSLARPIEAGSIRVIPITSKVTKLPPTEDYVSLEEATKNDWVVVSEIPGRAEVNALKVKNDGPKPLLLIGGELLAGGKQDRIVAHDTVVPSKETREVEVFCVEHGRWYGPKAEFKPTHSTVPSKVRFEAAKGSQDEVWKSVADYNRETAPRFAGTTVQGGLNSTEVQATVKKNYEALFPKLQASNNTVGFLFVSNGRIQGMEIFGNNKLFNMMSPSILKGYLADVTTTDGGQLAQPTMSVCAKFVADALGGQQTSVRNETGSLQVERKAAAARGFETFAGSPTASSKSQSRPMLHGNYTNSSR